MFRPVSPRFPFGVLITLLLGACSKDVAFTDPYGPDDGTLRQPYLVGSEVLVHAGLPRRLQGNARLSARSTDPGVFEVLDVLPTEEGDLDVAVVGHAAGTALLEIVRGERVIDSSPVTFAVADDVAFVPGALERLGFSDLADPVLTPRVLAGGLASFRVLLLSDSEPVYGEAIVDPPVPMDGLDVLVDEYYGDVLGPWLWFEPASALEKEVVLTVNSEQDVDFTVRGVEPADLQSIRLYRQSEIGVEDGTSLGVTAVGTDAEGESVYGLPVVWSLDGNEASDWGEHLFTNPVIGPETFWYEYDSELPRLLTAELGGLEDAATVHGVPASDCNCGVASDRPSLGLILAGALALVRRGRNRA